MSELQLRLQRGGEATTVLSEGETQSAQLAKDLAERDEENARLPGKLGCAKELAAKETRAAAKAREELAAVRAQLKAENSGLVSSSRARREALAR